MELKEYLGDIITVLQILIGAGIPVRCFFIIRSGRENECPWKQIFNQIKKLIIIGVITITVVEIIEVIGNYFIMRQI